MIASTAALFIPGWEDDFPAWEDDHLDQFLLIHSRRDGSNVQIAAAKTVKVSAGKATSTRAESAELWDAEVSRYLDFAAGVVR